MNETIILASSSTYRAALLTRLNLSFKTLAANIDESQRLGERPSELVKRLSLSKAQKIAIQHPETWVIGSDQIAVFNEQVIGKPKEKNNAIKQLQLFSGHPIKFLTGVCLVNHNNNNRFYHESITKVHFKSLSIQQIERYLDYDQPYDCAGSFKVESLGIALFKNIFSDDPTALEGLPLIALCDLFEQANIKIV